VKAIRWIALFAIIAGGHWLIAGTSFQVRLTSLATLSIGIAVLVASVTAGKLD
jgi:membrane protein implicated in regulation of membrane protease activity